MKSIHSKRFAVDITTLSVLFALIVSCSYVSLAGTNRPVGEILISGASADGRSVTVNGEAVKSGRTIFEASSIVTPAGQTAIVNLGKAGRIQIAPDSVASLDVNGDNVSGSLTSGSLTVVGSVNPVNITNASGDKVAVNSGESISAASSAVSKKRQGGVDWWVWAAIVGGAAAAVVLIVALRDDDNTVTSPVR